MSERPTPSPASRHSGLSWRMGPGIIKKGKLSSRRAGSYGVVEDSAFQPAKVIDLAVGAETSTRRTRRRAACRTSRRGSGEMAAAVGGLAGASLPAS